MAFFQALDCCGDTLGTQPSQACAGFPRSLLLPIICSSEDQLSGHDKASLACTFKTIFEIRFLFGVGEEQGGLEGRRKVLSFQVSPRDGTQVAGLAASDFTSSARVSETACDGSFSMLQAYLKPSLQGQHHYCALVFWNPVMIALPSFLTPLPLPFCQAVLGQGTRLLADRSMAFICPLPTCFVSDLQPCLANSLGVFFG